MSDLPDLAGLESNLTAPAKRKTVQQEAPARYRIQLEENDAIPPTGLPLGHNGRAYLLRAGEPVDVPAAVLEILEHAIMSTPIMDPSSQQVLGYRDRMRYPFRVLSAA